jgi:hypothetical protein
MVCLATDGVLGEWLASLPGRFPGNRMDTINTLLVVLPPDETLALLPADDIVYLPTDPIYTGVVSADGLPIVDDDAMLNRLITLVGATLAQVPNNKILIGTAVQWRQLYGTPHWHLWCAPHIYESDSDEQYQTDLAYIGLPGTTTRAEARELIKTMVAG